MPTSRVFWVVAAAALLIAVLVTWVVAQRTADRRCERRTNMLRFEIYGDLEALSERDAVDENAKDVAQLEWRVRKLEEEVLGAGPIPPNPPNTGSGGDPDEGSSWVPADPTFVPDDDPRPGDPSGAYIPLR